MNPVMGEIRRWTNLIENKKKKDKMISQAADIGVEVYKRVRKKLLRAYKSTFQEEGSKVRLK